MSAEPPADPPPAERQRVERVPGSRRVRLTPAPGSRDEPVEAADDESGDGANDERMRREVPPHY